MPFKSIVLYIFMFCLGFAYADNIQDATSVDRPGYLTLIEEDIGSNNPTLEAEKYEREISIHVLLREITVLGRRETSSVQKICEKSDERDDFESLEMIEIPIVCLETSDVIIKDIGEILKNC